jgi:ornithine decarboxylase
MSPKHHRATPYLHVDLAGVESAYKEFIQAMPDVRVHYAMKCNPHKDILARLHSLGCSFEIASYNELVMLMAIGVRPQDVIFSNPVKVPRDITRAYKAGLRRFSFDSKTELEKLAANAPGADVFVRIKTIAANSGVPSEGKFGIVTDMALDLMIYARELGLRPYGIGFHVGSQMMHPDAWVEPIKQSAALMRELQKRDITITMLDMGGGFPAYYGTQTPTVKDFATVIAETTKSFLPYTVDLAIEPGRALVGNAGTMVTTVIGRAERPNGTWVHVDVGAFNGMMEALESQNQFLFPVTDSKNSDTKMNCNLTGPSCDSQDTILFGAQLSHNLTVGDKVFIHTAGAYTASYASRFNGFDIPKVYCE